VTASVDPGTTDSNLPDFLQFGTGHGWSNPDFSFNAYCIPTMSLVSLARWKPHKKLRRMIEILKGVLPLQ